MEIQNVPNDLKGNNPFQKPAGFKNYHSVPTDLEEPGMSLGLLTWAVIPFFSKKNIFPFQLKSEGKILVLLKSVHASPLIFTQTDFYSYLFFFFSSFAWDCTEGIEMDYLGLQPHNIQREEQLEPEIEEMKRHQRDQLDLPAILHNFVCCLQKHFQPWRSRWTVTATLSAQPHFFHYYYFMFLPLISSSHLPVVVSLSV